MIWAGDNKTDMLATWNVLCIGAEAIVTSNLAVELNVANGSKVIVKEVVPHPEDHQGWREIQHNAVVKLSRPPIIVFVEPIPIPGDSPSEYNYHPQGSYYPFSEATGSDIVEFRIHGTVMDSPFLKGGPTSFSHSVSLDLSDEDIELLKSYVYKIPNYEPDTYRWPIQVNAAKFTCKENVNQPFTDIWEIDDEKLIRNEDLRSPISYERVKKGTPVWVEYTIVGYNGKRPRRKTQTHSNLESV